METQTCYIALCLLLTCSNTDVLHCIVSPPENTDELNSNVTLSNGNVSYYVVSLAIQTCYIMLSHGNKYVIYCIYEMAAKTCSTALNHMVIKTCLTKMNHIATRTSSTALNHNYDNKDVLHCIVSHGRKDVLCYVESRGNKDMLYCIESHQ